MPLELAFSRGRISVQARETPDPRKTRSEAYKTHWRDSRGATEKLDLPLTRVRLSNESEAQMSPYVLAQIFPLIVLAVFGWIVVKAIKNVFF